MICISTLFSFCIIQKLDQKPSLQPFVLQFSIKVIVSNMFNIFLLCTWCMANDTDKNKTSVVWNCLVEGQMEIGIMCGGRDVF